MLKKMIRTALMAIVFGMFCCGTAMAASRNEIQSELLRTLYGGSGGRISCDFDGYTTTAGRHEGIDCAKRKGATVYSLVAGTVVRANNPASGLSTLAIYDSANNRSVIYLHATSFKVKAGQKVSKGQAIAVEGTKGTGSAHTHVEVRSGKQGYASISLNDPVLNNANPYPYWESVLLGETKLQYRTHVENNGWLAIVDAGQTSGTVGEARKAEALICYLTVGGKSGIKYRAHCQEEGWGGWKSSGEVAGTTGKNLRMEAVQIKLCNGLEKQYDVLYRTHVQDIGWTSWVKNGATSGTTGRSLRVESLQIKLVRK